MKNTDFFVPVQEFLSSDAVRDEAEFCREIRSGLQKYGEDSAELIKKCQKLPRHRYSARSAVHFVIGELRRGLFSAKQLKEARVVDWRNESIESTIVCGNLIVHILFFFH